MADKETEEMEDEVIEDLRHSFRDFRQDNNESDLILVAVQRCLDNKKMKALNTVLLEPDNRDILEFVGWELISVLSQQGDFQTDNNYRDLLGAIAEICSPKEVCLGILEQMDSNSSSETFLALLFPLQKVFQRIKGRKSKFLKMAIPQILHHITMIQSSDDDDNTCTISNERENSIELSSVLDPVLSFLESLVSDTNKEASELGDDKDHERKAQNWELTKCLVGLLEPLAFKNLTLSKISAEIGCNHETDTLKTTKSCSVYRVFAQKILVLLHKLNPSSVYLMEYASINSKCYAKENKTYLRSNDVRTNERENENEDDETELEVLSLLGLSCFEYLLFVENMADCHIPQVFRLEYLLKINLACIKCLLQRTKNQVIYKGLELVYSLINKIEDGEIEHYLLTWSPGLLDIFKELINIMVYCTSKTLRQKATKVLQLLISKLETRGRYMTSRYLLLDCTHAGVAGLIIHNIKEEVHKNLNSNDDDKWFNGTQLISLLLQVFKLPQGVGKDVDLIPETERVMAALNCLRYILLRDQDDKTTLWKNYSLFEREFLSPLREALKITRLRYIAMQNDNKKEMIQSDKKKDKTEGIEFKVTTPDGTPINEISLEDQSQILQSGLYALEMIECILAHITEIVNSKTRQLFM